MVSTYHLSVVTFKCISLIYLEEDYIHAKDGSIGIGVQDRFNTKRLVHDFNSSILNDSWCTRVCTCERKCFNPRLVWGQATLLWLSLENEGCERKVSTYAMV